jgi:hypothetical protein
LVAHSPHHIYRGKEQGKEEEEKRKLGTRSRRRRPSSSETEAALLVFFFTVGGASLDCTVARLHYLESPLHRYPSAMSPR